MTGKMPAALMRACFERMVKETSALTAETPLDVVETGGKFERYKDDDTDHLWCGFALGMRCLERIVRHNGQDILDDDIEKLLRVEP